MTRGVMPSEVRPKALNQSYSHHPFFFKERRKQGTRFVAWIPNLSQLKLIFCDLLKHFPQSVEVLFKITDGEIDPKKWRRFYGISEQSGLRKAILLNEKVVFQDGGAAFNQKPGHR